MVGVNIVGNVDFASVAIWMFWLFFALLIVYLQTENMREGYPLEDDEGNPAPNQGPFFLPKEKTFHLPHGRGEVTVPNMKPEGRDLALRKADKAQGAPFIPTGDPMVDGVGPASWAPRRDIPELDGRGHPKIIPMGDKAFIVSAGTDPRGKKVVSGDGEVVGTISDMWLDEPEQLVRYLEMKLESDGSKRLIPMQMAKIRKVNTLAGGDPFVKVRSLFAHQFAGVPTTASGDQVTMLEEEKICGYYGGGTLYASEERMNPVI